jgi:hypothetical protein
MAGSELEWSSQVTGKSGNAPVVAFPVAAAEDLEKWLTIAAQVGQGDARVQFVGVCVPMAVFECKQMSSALSSVTLLEYVDPIQMRALVIAQGYNQALLYRDWALIGPLEGGVQQLTNAIVAHATDP